MEPDLQKTLNERLRLFSFSTTQSFSIPILKWIKTTKFSKTEIIKLVAGNSGNMTKKQKVNAIHFAFL